MLNSAIWKKISHVRLKNKSNYYARLKKISNDRLKKISNAVNSQLLRVATYRKEVDWTYYQMCFPLPSQAQ